MGLALIHRDVNALVLFTKTPFEADAELSDIMR